MKKTFLILLNAVPVLVMVALIPAVRSDYILTAIYICIIAIFLFVKKKRGDIRTLIFGFVIMLAAEYIFIQTGVETFNRNSLFGLMPLWLPFLWAYGFLAIKRSLEILNS